MDPYIHSRSHLLKNKANLHTPVALATHEARMVFKRLIFLYSRPVTGTFDLAHLLAMYDRQFGQWAKCGATSHLPTIRPLP